MSEWNTGMLRDLLNENLTKMTNLCGFKLEKNEFVHDPAMKYLTNVRHIVKHGVESGVFFGVEFGVSFGVKFGVILVVDFKFNIAHI